MTVKTTPIAFAEKGAFPIKPYFLLVRLNISCNFVLELKK